MQGIQEELLTLSATQLCDELVALPIFLPLVGTDAVVKSWAGLTAILPLVALLHREMLNSAWEWLISLVGASQEGVLSDFSDAIRPKAFFGDNAPWLQRCADGPSQSAMLECILDDEREDSLCQALLLHDVVGSGAQQTIDRIFTCPPKKHAPGYKKNSHSSQELHEHVDEAKSTREGNIASESSHLPPPPLLESASSPGSTPPRAANRGSSLDDVVCQTSKDAEAAGGATWDKPFATKPSSGSSPKSVFDCFSQDEYLLPPQLPKNEGKRTLVLDLDETLVHSVFQPTPAADFHVRVELEQGPLDVYVLKRPGVDAFLEAMAEHFEVVVFTASVKEYAEPLMDQLDPRGLVSHRLFRDSCTNTKGGFAKDLARLGRKLSDTIIVDNSPHAYSLQPDNALPILSFYDDASDVELQKITPFLQSVGSLQGDVRSLLSSALGANVKSLLHSRLAFLL